MLMGHSQEQRSRATKAKVSTGGARSQTEIHLVKNHGVLPLSHKALGVRGQAAQGRHLTDEGTQCREQVQAVGCCSSPLPAPLTDGPTED